MDFDSEERHGNDGENKKWKRPPSSYGSMKSDSEKMEDEEWAENEEEEHREMSSPLPDELSGHEATGMQLIRSESPETIYTMATQQPPPGAHVIDTRSYDMEDFEEDPEEDLDEPLITNSPEPPEPVEPDDWVQADDNSQPGRLHPEQDLPHIFKSIQNSLSSFTVEELFKFKMYFLQWEKSIPKQQAMEGDILDFVDKILEILGQDRSLNHTISTLESIGKKAEANELQSQCKRALIRIHLTQHLIRKHRVIREGVVRAGKHNLLNTIYVEPQISTCGNGGVDPFHEFRSQQQSTLQVTSADTFVGVNDLFRLQKDDGKPVRTVLTTGIPGIGMSVSVGKFSLDWAELRANKDLQFVIKLSFRSFWILRQRNLPDSPKMSIMEVIQHYYPECKDMKYLDEEDCKFLIIMDSFDRYQASLEWETAPVINDNYTQAHPDVLIVNIIRGTVLRGAKIWILGRRAAVSKIPSQFIDVVTEIQGFSDEMKDDYLTKRFTDARLAERIVAHHKRLPTLNMLARNPSVCWMVATVFERFFCYHGYGTKPPRLTPFYINILIFQTNRRLQFYCGIADNNLKWSNDDKQMLAKIGKMAFKMLEKKTSVFFEEDVMECDLNLTEVTVFSGLCTELPAAASNGRRTFCFMHITFQEFIAALYVFMMFRTESRNILDSGTLSKVFMSKYNSKPAAGLIQCALEKTLSSPLGEYDMFLRFLCGLLSPTCHTTHLSGVLYPRNTPEVSGLDEVQQLLEENIHTAPGDRVENLKECLREMTQKDE
ncbi:protein NLRC3-like [Echeneis naucrates]|uniref:Protein NLRC3-like n=1 Tax=Echeneis naucrates TaxID=173247 RepID=A0A665U6E0_ECHNA|nr:protein NLRC3-like [Echeneis naucrates]